MKSYVDSRYPWTSEVVPNRAGAVKSLEYGLLTVAAPLLLLAAACEHLLDARWHGEFELGTPKTVKIGRFFLKYLATSHLYPSKFEKFQKKSVTQYISIQKFSNVLQKFPEFRFRHVFTKISAKSCEIETKYDRLLRWAYAYSSSRDFPLASGTELKDSIRERPNHSNI